MEIAIILGLIALLVYLLYTSKDIVNKPQGDIAKGVWKVFDTKNISVFLFILASWVVVAIIGFINVLGLTQPYEPLLQGVFIAVLWGNVMFNILYLAVYIIYLVSMRLSN